MSFIKKKKNKQAKKSVLQGFYSLVFQKKKTHPNRWKLEIIVGGGVDEGSSELKNSSWGVTLKFNLDQ